MELAKIDSYHLLCSFLTLCILCTCASSELQISSTDQPQRLFDSPDRIKVGNALDVAVEVQCTSIGGPAAARVRWSFAENGTAVEEGLKAFGTSQSSDGVLRIYPAASLSPSGTTFQCRDVENDQSLNVTFELQEGLFFINLNLEAITDVSGLYNSCLSELPDIPSANVSIVNETNPFSGVDYHYCLVETERGAFQSSRLTFQVENLGPSPSFSQIIPSGNELVAAVGSPVLKRCLSGPLHQWLKDGSEFSSINSLISIPAIAESDAGIYQCLVFSAVSSPEFAITAAMGTVYALVQVLDVSTLEVTPSSSNLTLGLDDDLVSLNCSVRAHPLPLIEWSREGESVNGAQAATGFMETSFSTLSLNTTELGVGTHIFVCSATVDTPTTAAESSVVMATITVQALLQDINIVPGMETLLISGGREANLTVELNCSVEASPPPSIQWMVNGASVVGGPVAPAGDLVFYSSLVVMAGDLEEGQNNITCTAFQDAQESVTDTATIVVESISSTMAPTSSPAPTPSITSEGVSSMMAPTSSPAPPTGITTSGDIITDALVTESALLIAPGIIAAIAASLFVFVVILLLAVVMGVAMLLHRQSHSQKKRKSVFPSQSGTFTAMTSIDGPNGDSNGVAMENGTNSVHLTSFKNSEIEPEIHNTLPVDDSDVQFPMSVEAFPQYCVNMQKNSCHPFTEEFKVISIRSPNLPYEQASRPCNVSKNRYANIRCNDKTRVQLDYMSGTDGSDFIHANFIDGYHRRNEYIATQGPLPHTMYDFWRMVWEMNTSCIVMLTNLIEKTKTKCHPYWPELVDGTLTIKDIVISPVRVEQLAYYTVRSFNMTRGEGQSRLVRQFHYTGWPDFGVPESPHPIIAFIRHLDNFVRPTRGPDIIHCSAGVGRTGALIAIQSMMKMMEKERKIDIFNFVLSMRSQRNFMVQTERQYIFIHHTLLEVLSLGRTEIPVQDFPGFYEELIAQDPDMARTRLEEEFYHLNNLECVREDQFKAAKSKENVSKNRYQDILPYDKYRVRLLGSMDPSDYINASHIDGYRQRAQYILTQGPLEYTTSDFWRMVWEYNSTNIVMLCPLEEDDKEQCVQYWPNERKVIRQYDSVFIEMTDVTDCIIYTKREFSLTNSVTNEKRVVSHYQHLDWTEGQSSPNHVAVIELIDVIQRSQVMSGGPVIVHDSTSIGRSGTFCVLSSVLEQLKVEGIVDPFFTIHSLRQQQPGLVQTFGQYKFCHDAVLIYLESLATVQK